MRPRRPDRTSATASRRRLVRACSLLLGLVLVTGACGIPVDEEPLAFEPVTPTTTGATPSPQPADTQLFPVYLVDANSRDGKVRPAIRELPEELTITALVNELTEEPTDQESALSLVTVIPAETAFFADPSSADQTAVLDFLGGTSLDTLTGDPLTLALAQLVWTLTESPSITSIIIRIDGEEQNWPTDEDDKRGPLTRDDYDEFGPDFEQPTPTPEATPPSEEDSGGG